MRKAFFCFSLAWLIFCSHETRAQSLAKKFSVGFGLEAGLPEGDVKNLYSFNGGLTLRFSYRLGHGFVTFTTGGIGYAPLSANINENAAIQVPVKAGYKYIIHRHFFVMGELGYSVFRAYYKDLNDKTQFTNSSGFTYAPSAGIQFGALEIGILYEMLHADDLNIARGAVRLGFNF
jgi:opacity protein-like surface antigen